MNNYQKLTLESFIKDLHAKKFKGIAGARRSIGKAQISKADRERAQLAINKFYGVEGAGPKKVASKKVAKKAAKAAPKKAAKQAAPKKVATKKAAVHRGPVARALHDVAEPVNVQLSATGDERAVRANSAAMIVSAMYGRAPIDKDLEKRLLDRAGREYLANVDAIRGKDEAPDTTPVVKSHERIARPRIAVQKPSQPKAEAPAAPLVEAAPPPNGESSLPADFDENNCTPEQRRQWELLRDAKEVAERGGAAS